MRNRSFFSELKRRRVTRMAGWYAAGAFVVIQFAQVMQDALYLPPWILTATFLAAFAGMPIALLLSWQFDITPAGSLRSEHRAPRRSGVSPLNWPKVGIPLLVILGLSVAAISATDTRRLLAFGRAPVLVCPDGSEAPCRLTPPMEPKRFVVLPLSHREGTDPALMDGELCAHLIAEGLSHWRDINVADQPRVNDALRRLSDDVRMHLPVDTGLAIAREVGAGKLIMGELWRLGDTTRLTTVLYDVKNGRVLKQLQARFATGSAEAKAEFYQLARLAVLEEAGVEVTVPVAAATTSLAALLAYDSAFKAIRNWDLPRAKQGFQTALQRDPAYPYAHLWLSYTMLWQNDTSDVWRFHAGRARSSAAALGKSEDLLARGIADMAEGRYDVACDHYRELLRRDASNFFGWSGLSECLAHDNIVVRDKNSPSGWSFRASGEEAIRAQRRALMLVPSFNTAFRNLTASRLGSLLYRRSSNSRMGVAEAPDTTRFAAFPALDHDTVAFTPYPSPEWGKHPIPATNAALVDRHRRILRENALQWASAFPDNPRALDALASSLEQTREIEESDIINHSALSALRAARKLEPDPDRRLRMAVAEVRMLVKLGRFRQARRMALRTLDEHENPTPAQARRLAALAALTGRTSLMADLLRTAASEFDIDVPITGEQPQPPLELARAASGLLAYASFGVPRDSIVALNKAAHDALNAYVAANARDVMHAAVLDRAARMVFPLLGPDDVHGAARAKPVHIELQALVARSDFPAIRAGLAQLDSLQAGVPIGDIAADGLLTETQLALAAGDTARATRKLDRYLSALADMSEPNFAQPYQPAALVQMMRIRAELAAESGDRATARKWARAVVDLWQSSDRALRPALRDMRTLARL